MTPLRLQCHEGILFVALVLVSAIVLVIDRRLFHQRRRRASPVMSKSAPHGSRTLVIPILLTLVAAGLRFTQLGTESLWFDELDTWRTAHALSACHAYSWLPINWSFLYNLIAAAGLHLWGATEYALRFPAALAGILAVPALYVAGTYLFDRKTATAAAAMLIPGYLMLYYSQEARSYSMMLAFGLLATYTWLRLLNEPRPGQWSTRFLVTAALTMHSHYFGLLLIAVLLALWGVVSMPDPAARRAWVRCSLLSAALYLPGLPILIRTLTDAPVQWWIVLPPSLPAAISTLTFDAFNAVPWSGVAVPVLWLAGLLLIVLRALRHDDDGDLRGYLLTLYLLLAPLILTWIISMRSPLFLNRYLLITIPMMYLLTARAIGVITGRWQAVGPILNGVIVVVMLAVLLNWQGYYSLRQKHEWREGIAALAETYHGSPDEAIIVLSLAGIPEMPAPYFEAAGLSVRRADYAVFNEPDRAAPGLSQYLVFAPQTIYIIGEMRHFTPEMQATVESRYEFVDFTGFRYLGLWTYQRTAP